MALNLSTEGKTYTEVHTLSDVTETNRRKHLQKHKLFKFILDRMSG